MTDYAELIDRLSGKYRVGPTNESGEPEFGYRQFPAPLVQLEAATAIARLTAENARLREALEHILKQRAAIESGQIPRPIHNVLAAIDRARQALGEPND